MPASPWTFLAKYDVYCPGEPSAFASASQPSAKCTATAPSVNLPSRSSGTPL